VHGGVGVEAVDLGDERELGDVLGEVDVDGADADLGAGLALHAHVRLRVLPAPHDHHRQPGHLRASGSQHSVTSYSIPTLAPDPRKNAPAATGGRRGGEAYDVVGGGKRGDLGRDLAADVSGDGLAVDDLRHRGGCRLVWASGWRRRRLGMREILVEWVR